MLLVLIVIFLLCFPHIIINILAGIILGITALFTVIGSLFSGKN